MSLFISSLPSFPTSHKIPELYIRQGRLRSLRRRDAFNNKIAPTEEVSTAEIELWGQYYYTSQSLIKTAS